MFISAALTMGLWLAAANLETPLVTVPDPQAALKPETGAERQARHARVAKARAGHGRHLASRRLAVCAGKHALRHSRRRGARGNGVELDFHRTLDGVIVLFHDDRLERMLDGMGRVDEYYYEELLLYSSTRCRPWRPKPTRAHAARSAPDAPPPRIVGVPRHQSSRHRRRNAGRTPKSRHARPRGRLQRLQLGGISTRQRSPAVVMERLADGPRYGPAGGRVPC